MSASHAFAMPQPQPRPTRETRHIEIVSSRSQRQARPRLAYSLIVIAGLFAVLASQLLLSIALADGAYQISDLQSQQKELSRAGQAVTEQLNVLKSPQNLAARAESLGMVSNESAVYLNLADGAVMGLPAAAKAGAGSVVGANGSLLIANSLLADVPGTLDPAVQNASGTTASLSTTASNSSATAGAPAVATSTGSVASTTTGIPGPTTR